MLKTLTFIIDCIQNRFGTSVTKRDDCYKVGSNKDKDTSHILLASMIESWNIRCFCNEPCVRKVLGIGYLWEGNMVIRLELTIRDLNPF